MPFITWWMLWQCSISWAALKRRRLSQLTSTNPCSSVEMVLPWISGQQFNQTTDRVRPEKKADCFTLLTRITSLKIVNSEIRSEDQGSYSWKAIPQRVHDILSNRRESHTCSELSLRILLWTASYVQQKQSSYTWEERVPERTRGTIKEVIAMVMAS